MGRRCSKKNAQTYLNERLDFRVRRRHVKVELWLPTYQRWEPLPYDAPVITSTEDKNIGILCSNSPMVALWKIVEIGRYEGVLCVSSDRRQTCYEWHPFVALVRCIRYGKFARFTDYLVCLFWPQVLTPSRGSRSWWINVCKYLFWLQIYCLLSLN